MSRTLNIPTEIITTLKNLAVAKFDEISLEDAQDQLLKAGELANAIIKLPHIVDLDQFEELKIENEAQQKLLFERSEKINQQQETITVLTIAAKLNSDNLQQPTERTSRHPDPDKFDGTRNKLRGFLGQLKLKISDRRSYPTPQDQLRYAASRLEGVALDQILPLLENDTVKLEDFSAFERVLKNAFDDPDRAGTAQRALRSLKQGNRDFSTYYAEFQRHAPDTGYDDIAKRAALRDGLSRELQTCLLPVSEPENLTEFVELCQRIDQKIRRMNPQIRPQFLTQSVRNPTAPPATLSTSTGTHAGPMDLSALYRKISPEEKARRMREGRCLYCAELGHMARECPGKANRSVRAAAATINHVAEGPTGNADQSGKVMSQA